MNTLSSDASASDASARRELILVMPVYNEAECIAAVVRDWQAQLDALQIDWEMLVLNDGSRDETALALGEFENQPRIQIINKPNSGHGPTILQGYRDAVSRATWVFQVDSDDEMKARHFPKLWEKREKYDAIFGFRHHRQQDSARRFLSGGSRVVVKLLFGRGVRDVNTPYRLMKSEVIAPILGAIAPDTFAPNVILSGVLSRQKRKISNVPVPHEGRKTGTASLSNARVWKVAWKSLCQTLRFRMPA